MSPVRLLALALSAVALVSMPALAYEVDRIDEYLARELARTGVTFKTTALRHAGDISYVPVRSLDSAQDLCLDQLILELRAAIALHGALFEENFTTHPDERVFREIAIDLRDFRAGAKDWPDQYSSWMNFPFHLRLKAGLAPDGRCEVTRRWAIAKMLRETLVAAFAGREAERLRATAAVEAVRRLSSLLPPPPSSLRQSTRAEKPLEAPNEDRSGTAGAYAPPAR